MTTDYDPIAEQYKRSKQQPWRTYIEAFTLMDLIGDPSGKEVIDIACGEGFYTRLLRQRGAEKVTGVDLSERMVELAKAQEAVQQLGIDYVVGDGRDLELGAKYDLAVAAYLLNYARDRGELGDMCKGIARCLRPGGRFVTVNCSPSLDFRVAPSYRKYGFKRASSASFARERQLPGLSFLKTVPLRSKITFSTPRCMRRRSDQPDFEKSAGMSLAYLLKGKRPVVETSGAASSTALP